MNTNQLNYIIAIVIIPLTFIFLLKKEKRHKNLVFAIIGFTLIGGLLNFTVISSNDWKMPVSNSYSLEFDKNNYNYINSDTKFKGLSDIIEHPFGYSSIGDMFLLVALIFIFIMLFVHIKELIEWKKLNS